MGIAGSAGLPAIFDEKELDYGAKISSGHALV
jgi:hypothetical protein